MDGLITGLTLQFRKVIGGSGGGGGLQDFGFWTQIWDWTWT